jgi:essential nuclear protein 1
MESHHLKQKELQLFLKPKLLKLLERASLFLRVYRSGKLPKILRILPNLKNFEEILWLTRPDIWSEQAIVVLTRFFQPKLDKNQLSRYYSLVLAPRFQESIFKPKSYSVHIEKAIKISIKCPSIFFSSIILPMCESDRCSNKEGVVISSIIWKYKFPRSVIMSALIRLTKDPITSAKCMLLRVIISKNYLISLRIIDLLIDFFSLNIKKTSPHYKNLLLVFLRNYFDSLSNEDKKKVFKLKTKTKIFKILKK